MHYRRRKIILIVIQLLEGNRISRHRSYFRQRSTGCIVRITSNIRLCLDGTSTIIRYRNRSLSRKSGTQQTSFRIVSESFSKPATTELFDALRQQTTPVVLVTESCQRVTDTLIPAHLVVSISGLLTSTIHITAQQTLFVITFSLPQLHGCSIIGDGDKVMGSIVSRLLHKTRRAGIGEQTPLAIIGIAFSESLFLNGLHFLLQQPRSCIRIDRLMTGNSVTCQLSLIIIGVRQSAVAIRHAGEASCQVVSIGGNVMIGIRLRGQFVKAVIGISRSARSSVADTGAQAISIVGGSHRITGRAYLYHTTGCIISISCGACGVALRHNIPLGIVYKRFRALLVRYSPAGLGLLVVSVINLLIQSRPVCRAMILLRQALVTVVSIIYGGKKTQSTVTAQRFFFHRQPHCVVAVAQMLPLASGLQFAL